MPTCPALQCGECPGINAFHCEGRGWVLSADEVNKIEFRGTHANIRYSCPSSALLSLAASAQQSPAECKQSSNHLAMGLPLLSLKVVHMRRRPTGLIRVDFHDGETLSFNPLVTTIQHIILGTHYIDHYGTLHVRSSHSGLSTKVKFKEPVIGPPQHKVCLQSFVVHVNSCLRTSEAHTVKNQIGTVRAVSK